MVESKTKTTLKVGESIEYRTKILTYNTAVYGGMPNADTFSMVIINNRNGSPNCAYPLYFPVTQEELAFENSKFVVHEVTPQGITLEERL